MHVNKQSTFEVSPDDFALATIDKHFVGGSVRAKQVKLHASKLARTRSSILLLGPTGSGKDVLAQAIHRASTASGDFVALNCAAIPADLLESELFGHEKGAFTGAIETRVGLFEQAHNGTIFLDEIGDMPLALQAKLLKVLEDRKIRRVGGRQEIAVNFRLICATHRDIGAMVKEETFREDLMYRISVFPITLPSLNERVADIPKFIDHFYKQYLGEGNECVEPQLSDGARRVLASYDWPGNVRELKNVVERALVLFPNQQISGSNVTDVLLNGKQVDITEIPEAETPVSGSLPDPLLFRNTLPEDGIVNIRGYLQDIEAELLASALSLSQGNVSAAAAKLGLQRTTYIEKLKKLGIQRP